MREACYFCHQQTIHRLIQKFQPTAKNAENYLFSMHQLLAENWSLDNPQLATEIHRLTKHHFKSMDLYAEEKVSANELLLGQYFYWKTKVNASENPFKTAAKLAVVGNIVDYGAHTVKDVSSQTTELFEQPLKVDESSVLRAELKKAKSVLYLGDNAGEIVMDRLFIETINHPNVTFAVRGKPIINDATLEDAQHVGMDKVCTVISNGHDAPSTILPLCSRAFKEVFDKADVIISKGMGNFEGLMKGRDKNIFFMLIAKCNPIASLLGVNKGDMLITRFKQTSHAI